MNILLVLEKPSYGKIIREVLENNKDIFTDTYYIDYIRCILHLNDDFVKIRKRNGEYYQGRRIVDLAPLKLDMINIPEDTYLESTGSKFSYDETIDHSIMDKIISICDPDVCGKLAFAKYKEHYNLKETFVLNVNDLSSESLKESLQFKNIVTFEEDFKKVKDFLFNKNFASEYPRKYDILTLREKTNMTRREFSNYFGIPYRTIENWEFDENLCPKYLYDLIEYKLKNEKLIK